QRWEASDTGTYVLAMTNNDIFLSGPHQCLSAPAERPFTFTVNVAHRGSGSTSVRKGGKKEERSAPTLVIEPGQSLWLIARGLVARPAGNANVFTEVQRLWRLNAARIGTGNPNLIFAGQELRLK